MKVIFLDFDGVLNNGKFLMMNRFNYPDLIMREKVGILNYIMGKTGAKIVFSTSWREDFRINELVKILERVGFEYGNDCIGVTPILACEERSMEIKNYINNNNVNKYVILDDNAKELKSVGDENHKLITNPNEGLTMDNANLLIKMFSSQDTE